jgi:hypothetical protein
VTFRANNKRLICEEYDLDMSVTYKKELPDVIGNRMEVMTYKNVDGETYEATRWDDGDPDEEWIVRDDDINNYTIARESKDPHKAVMQFICNVS